MSKKIKKSVPKLRFPDFSDDWNELKFSELIKLTSGQHLLPNEYSLSSDEIPYFTGPSDFTNDVSELTKWTRFSEKTAQKGDILITVKGNGVGEMLFLHLPCVAMGRQLMAIRPIKVVGAIIYQKLFTYKQQLQALASGNVIPGLSRSDILNTKIYLPKREEQEKIASFLGAIDKRLTELRRKHELLQTYKRGVMQKIFSQEVRFKGAIGSAFPDWQEKSLGQVLKPVVREIDKPSQNYLAVGIRSHMKGTFQKLESDPNKISMDKLYVVHYNDLIVNITFAWEGAIAIVPRKDHGGLVSHRFPTYRIRKEESSTQFFQYLIKQEKIKYILGLISPGGAGRNRVLNKKDFLKLKFSMPCPNEQEKIADFLTAIDQKIEAVARQVDRTEQFKKGLLQKMFV